MRVLTPPVDIGACDQRRIADCSPLIELLTCFFQQAGEGRSVYSLEGGLRTNDAGDDFGQRYHAFGRASLDYKVKTVHTRERRSTADPKGEEPTLSNALNATYLSSTYKVQNARDLASATSSVIIPRATSRFGST
jgi:hypothetical protein